MDIEFRRQGVRRLVFDHANAIPLSMLKPAESVDLKIEHPAIGVSGVATDYQIGQGTLTVSAQGYSESALWIGGFNPFATYDVQFDDAHVSSPEAGVEFATPDNTNRFIILAGFNQGVCNSLRWQVFVDGEEKQHESIAMADPVEGAFTFRVQMLGTGLNVFAEQNGVSRVVLTRDFSELIDLRKKAHIRSFEFRLLTRLNDGESVVVKEAGASLTTGAGQADICAMTYEDGTPLLDQGRLWFAMSIRGRDLPHPIQGILSMNPSVFDLRLDGIVVFDREDGLLRNEIGSHIFYDRGSEEWRGLTVGFSAYGDPDKAVPKQLWAVSSKHDPRFGFSIMDSEPVVMPNSGEDPHIVYDDAVKKWRVLACAVGDPGFPAALYESDNWNGPYELIAGPAEVNGTGCLLQKFGARYYCLFGSADRKFYIYSYPDLEELGALDMFRPPWDERVNTRCWPNVIPLPEGYPAPYIALSMDRANYPELDGWTYGALYLYHGYPK
ncbi:MAG: hypothetical protein QGH42_02090 [Kiritimatiellia bacterium]|nr:hypothetical protein [Kiritimatiellia bacterium]MDP7023027.1 hypothetical protein [Kiritimatiellia bacterium]